MRYDLLLSLDAIARCEGIQALAWLLALPTSYVAYNHNRAISRT
jgi:hypothetical protein